MRPLLVLPAIALLAACAPGVPAPASPDAVEHGPAAAAPRAEALRPVEFLHDDVDGALRRARAEGKLVLVDAWAPWCHTCLSMKSYVLTDPSLGAFADRVVFVAIDTDRPDAAPFLERHAVTSWPTFFLLDPRGADASGDRLIGYWPGSASVQEMRAFLEEGLAAGEAPAGAKPGDPSRLLVDAHAAIARGDASQAAVLYERAAAGGAPRRSEALLGWIRALYATKDWPACVRAGRAHLAEVTGAAAPADYAYYVGACASELPPGAEREAARADVIERLRRLTASPPPGATADDRADAGATLADLLGDAGDRAGARRANEARLAIMEEAARAAPTPAIAATFDYGRAKAYVALGRGDEARRMLGEREARSPEAYEPPARLAEVLLELGELPDALAAIDRAIARAYGPRKLRYLKLRAEIQGKLGDRAGQLATLREELRGHEALARGQVNAERLADAKRRLEEAERTATGAK